MKKALSLICALMALSLSVLAQERPQAYVGARVIPINGAPIENGVIVVQRGKIIAVGASGSTTIPADAETHDVTGKVMMPGLVDSHSHIGGPAGGDSSSPIQPDARVFDSLNPLDRTLKRARAGGVTTANVMPGSGHLLSGQTVYIKLRNVTAMDDLVIRDAQGNGMGGMKMANGTNSIRQAPFPGTRAKSVALMREQLIKAQEYREKIRKAEGDKDKMPARDLAMEGLVEVLDGKRIVHFHTHRHDDILSVLMLSKEFGFRVVLHHVTEGDKVADQIAAAKVSCSLTIVDSPGGKLETMDSEFQDAAILDRAGVVIAINTDDPITDSRFLMRSAALTVRGGLSREKALYGLTMAGAIMLDLGNRVGSLEAGKDADFLVLSGDPLSVYTHVLQTYVEGKKVFDRTDPKDLLFATGGYGASKGDMDMDDDGDGGER